MSTDILEIRNLSASYGAVQALHGVGLRVPQGAVVSLIGANGAGKTTALKVVSGLKRPDSGEVLFKGLRVDARPAHELVRMGLVHCPEGRGVFPNLTVMENLRLGAYTRRDKAQAAMDLDWVWSLFPRLFERRRQGAGTLSGGEQQMLAMGRSLMARPALLLMDEPSLGLAPQVVDSIFEAVLKINRQGCSILLVEQNAQRALEISSLAWVLETGRVLLHGPAAEISRNPRVREAYLGEGA